MELEIQDVDQPLGFERYFLLSKVPFPLSHFLCYAKQLLQNNCCKTIAAKQLLQKSYRVRKVKSLHLQSAENVEISHSNGSHIQSQQRIS